jgi:hypothetical protein
MTWGKQGREIANKLGELTDEDSIKALACAAIQEIKRGKTLEKRSNALKMVSREVLKKFPRRDSEAECYYHDPSGKADLPKWRHVIFKYLTLDSTDGEAVRGEETTEKPTEQLTEQPTKESTEQPTEESTEQAITTLNDMTIEQLELDTDTQKILESALDQSGMPLADFIRQAIKVYAKTITGKTQKRGEDLSTVPTDKLLSDPTYSTHPGRAEELTKRAIRTIKYFNANIATEKADRWCITQSAIASLTGSRASAIGKTLEQYKTEIDDHNQSYGLDGYSNRKPGKKIEEIINLSNLCPDGLD